MVTLVTLGNLLPRLNTPTNKRNITIRENVTRVTRVTTNHDQIGLSDEEFFKLKLENDEKDVKNKIIPILKVRVSSRKW